MGSNESKLSPTEFPNPDMHPYLGDAFNHLWKAGCVFEGYNDNNISSTDLIETGSNSTVATLKMTIPDGWSLMFINGMNHLILNSSRIPEVWINAKRIQPEKTECKIELVDEPEPETETHLKSNPFDVLKDTIQETIKITTSPVRWTGYILDGWNDSQIPDSFLSCISTPLPNFYQIEDGKMVIYEYSHFAMIAKEVHSLKKRIINDVSKYSKVIGGTLELFQKLKRCVNDRTDMYTYIEFRKCAQFLNNPIPDTPEKVLEYALQKYRKHCLMTPEERKSHNASIKLGLHVSKRDKIICFSEGVNFVDLSYNLDDIPISMFVEE